MSRQIKRSIKYWETKLQKRKQRSMQHLLVLMCSDRYHSAVQEVYQKALDRNEKRVKDIERKIMLLKGAVVIDR